MGNPFRRANLLYRLPHSFCFAEEGQISGFDPLPHKIRCRSARKKAQILKMSTSRWRYVQIPGNSVSVSLRKCLISAVFLKSNPRQNECWDCTFDCFTTVLLITIETSRKSHFWGARHGNREIAAE